MKNSDALTSYLMKFIMPSNIRIEPERIEVNLLLRPLIQILNSIAMYTRAVLAKMTAVIIHGMEISRNG